MLIYVHFLIKNNLPYDQYIMGKTEQFSVYQNGSLAHQNGNAFLRKISHSDGTWTNFGKVIALDSSLHIFFLFTFLILFFSLFILKKTNDAFESTIRSYIANEINTVKEKLDSQLSPTEFAAFYGFLGGYGENVFSALKNYFNTEDKFMSKNNYFVWFTIILVIVFLFIITCLLVAPYFEKNRGGKLLHIMGLNLFILILVGAFEGLFITFVLQTEQHVNGDEIKNYVIKSFEEKFNLLLEGKSVEQEKEDKYKNIVIVLSCTLVALVVFVPIIWFYVMPKLIRFFF